MPNKNEVLRQYSSDLLSLDKQILDIVKDQANLRETERYPEVRELIRTTHGKTSQRLRGTGTEPVLSGRRDLVHPQAGLGQGWRNGRRDGRKSGRR